MSKRATVAWFLFCTAFALSALVYVSVLGDPHGITIVRQSELRALEARVEALERAR